MRSSVLVGAVVSDLFGLGGGADPSSPEGGGYLQGTPMLKLARVLNRY